MAHVEAAGAVDPLRLVVAETSRIADGIHRFELVAPGGAPLPPFTAGAHIGVRVPNGSMRKYSLCNDPAERRRYVIAVQREAEGRGASVSLIDEAPAGTALECTAPRNDFPLAERAKGFLFIAGGIGIAPILSMIRHLEATGRHDFTLYYCTRHPAATAFRDELCAPAMRDRVVFHHDGGHPDNALDLWPLLERPTGAHLYCCGPRPMLEAVRDMTGHWSASTVHFESFIGADATHRPEDRAFRVRLARSGSVVEVPADRSILDALRAAGYVVASSCESGTCGTCRTGLVAGDADHRDLVLSDDEREENIMVCVSRARSDELVIDR